jgi:hypothetical protein
MEAIWFGMLMGSVVMVSLVRVQGGAELLFGYQEGPGQWIERGIPVLVELFEEDEGVHFLGWSRWTGEWIVAHRVGDELEWAYMVAGEQVVFRTVAAPSATRV